MKEVRIGLSPLVQKVKFILFDFSPALDKWWKIPFCS